MQNSKNISITLPPRMLKEAEEVARREGRTKSELFREALRQYITQRKFRKVEYYGMKEPDQTFSRLMGSLRSDVRLSDSQLKAARTAFGKNWARHE